LHVLSAAAEVTSGGRGLVEHPEDVARTVTQGCCMRGAKRRFTRAGMCAIILKCRSIDRAHCGRESINLL